MPYGQMLPEGFCYPDLGDAKTERTVAVLNPGATKPFTFPIDTAEIERARKKEIVLFIYGHIDYIDIFGNQQSSQFNYEYVPIFGDNGQPRGHRLIMQARHNDAT
jgi:hypothetical protein